MKIYHTETQADYDALMNGLEKQGCKWLSDRKPTEAKCDWFNYGKKTCVRVSSGILTRCDFSYYKEGYPNIPIIKYKAKADEKMKFTKENVEKVIDEYFWQADLEPCGDLIAEIHNLDDTPEKVEVKKFVAEFYEGCKDANLYFLITQLESEDFQSDLGKWYRDCEGRHISGRANAQEVIAKMKLYGYEVEKEPLYHVVNKDGGLMLFKLNGVVDATPSPTSLTIDKFGQKPFYQLTEKEIKDYDERYWPFAVPAND